MSWGVAFCKQVMSRNRFKEILRFDNKSSRSERLRIDKFALFSMVWNRFVENSIACYKPGAFLTVDEQLFPSKQDTLSINSWYLNRTKVLASSIQSSKIFIALSKSC